MVQRKQARTQWAIIPRHLTRWAAALVRHPTDPTHIALVIRVVVASVPAPLGDCAPVLDVDSHQGLSVTNESTASEEGDDVVAWRYHYLRTPYMQQTPTPMSELASTKEWITYWLRQL